MAVPSPGNPGYSGVPDALGTGARGARVVALGGGHGLSATLSAVRHLTSAITAIVTVADDGGSSGRLRSELGVLPPGDLRMALSALCDDGEWGQTWRDVLQHRLHSEGPLDNHSVGNILIVALWRILGDEVQGLEWVASLLGVRGRVVPMSAVPLDIEADVVVPGTGEVRVVRGQSRVAKVDGRVRSVRLLPADPPARPEGVAAVREADWVILGPGSWYTSVVPHLLVPELVDALCTTTAHRALILNLSNDDSESEGMTVSDHLRSLHDHAPDLRLDVVVADPLAVDDLDELERAAAAIGARTLLRQVRATGEVAVHDPLRLAAALRDAMERIEGDVDATGRADAAGM
ncbi:gluconeogenesis factor YvcK family protein [Georgenia sp. Z1344]|uniref:gluconeogenesis factor YvcK family protein n=1 Tax=Georgenia sp. Z1344 TaxID=3416706 RepID=UPI003CF7ACD2